MHHERRRLLSSATLDPYQIPTQCPSQVTLPESDRAERGNALVTHICTGALSKLTKLGMAVLWLRPQKSYIPRWKVH